MLITSLRDRNKSEVLRSHNRISQVNRCTLINNNMHPDLIKDSYGILPVKRLAKPRNVSFSSNPLYNINLKKLMPNGKYEFIMASFSQLIKNDKNDMECVSELKKAWDGETKYGGYIANDFLQDKSSKESYFITEIIDPQAKPYEKITCIMQTANPEKTKFRRFLDVKFIQSSPNIADSKNPKFKGSGELSLYGVVKLAKENGFEKIRMISLADKFYKKIGFDKKAGFKRIGKYDFKVTFFELSSSNFDSFLKRVSQKYNLS